MSPSITKTQIQPTLAGGLMPPAHPSLEAAAANPLFAESLARLRSPRENPAKQPASADPTEQARAEKAAGDLISNALILPLLKQVRRSPWSENTVFSPGIGEKTFGAQFDMQISDRIAHNRRLGLKTALAQRLVKRGQMALPPDAKNNAILVAYAGLNVHG